MRDPYADLGAPVDQTAQPQPADAAPHQPQQQADPYASLATDAAAVPAPDQGASTTDDQSVPGFTDEQQRQIIDYLPKALKAADPVADLERYSLELSGQKAKIGNAKEVIDKLNNKTDPTAFRFTPPTIDKSMAPQAGNLRDTIGEGILNALDQELPGLGTFLRLTQGAGKAFTEHAANAAAADYGPEIGGVIDTILHGGDVGNNADHERAIMQGDSEGHPVASLAGELTGAAAAAPLAGKAASAAIEAVPMIADAAAAAPKIASAAKAATGGAAFGSGAAGPGDRVTGAVTGAAMGAATDVAAPIVAKFVAATKAADTTAAAEAAKAAHDLGIDLPKFVVGSAKDARKASALEQSVVGAGTITGATNKMLDQSEAARTAIADSLGTAASTNAQLGDEALNAAVAKNKALRATGSALYTSAKAATSDATVSPTGTLANIDALLAEENAKIGGSKIAPILQRYRDDLASAGQITIDQARNLRTDLREQLGTDANATPDKMDRIVKTVMSGVNDDMTIGLLAAGKPDAVKLYEEADANWAQQRELEDTVLKPFLGKNFDNWGEDVAKKILTDAKGNGTRLARFLNTLPEDDANRVRATLVSRLGTSRDAAQNAAGDVFSLDTFLTNWNELKGSRNLILPKDTVQSLDKLAKVADVAKSFGRKLNRSNTGGVVSAIAHGMPTAIGTGGAIFTHDPHVLGYGLLLSGLSGVKQYGAAKLLASPAFAKKLAATPMSGAGARAFWSRPWVKALQVKNPSIAAEIQAFQSAILSPANDNAGTLSSAAASPDDPPGDVKPLHPDQYDRSTWAKRPDGSDKGTGFLGVMRRPDGSVSSEISIGVPIDGKEMDIPTMVPGLTPQETKWLLTTPVSRVAKDLPEGIRQKAIAHAKERISAGKSPFRQDNE